MTFSQEIQNFPITEHLEKICSTLLNSTSHSLILTAETGAGKSTVLPLALLQAFNGKIIMTEPRRLAALGVADRVSSLLGQKSGQSVGYKIHLENKISSQTRLEVMTEGILVRMLQEDPVLENYSLVVLDEFHERTINTDMALSFLKEAMMLRDDLFVIVMSATIDSKKVSAFLNDAPVMKIPGRTFPVNIKYEPELNVENAVISQLNLLKNSNSLQNSVKNDQNSQNLLVFLPGISEIRKTQEAVNSWIFEQKLQDQFEVCILHSSISLEEQKHVLSKTPEGVIRVILSSAIAETSLTVPGVSIVIDSGLSRVNRIDLSTGMENLVTENSCIFSSDQRAGRAGRVQEGTCIRLWNKLDIRQKELAPEILRTDLNEFVLECYSRGITSLSSIDLLDSPTQNAWNAAENFLQILGCISSDKKITDFGKAVLSLGCGLRLACIALSGCDESGKLRSETQKILTKYGQYSKASANIQNQFLQKIQKDLTQICRNSAFFNKFCSNSSKFNQKFLQNSSFLLLSGFPDRIAKLTSEPGKSPVQFQFPSGRIAVLHNSLKTNAKWIVAPEVLAGNNQGLIFSFEELPQELAEEWINLHSSTQTQCTFNNGKILKEEITSYQNLILSTRKLQSSKEDYASAWMNEIKTKGISCLPSSDKISSFFIRLNFLNQQTNDYSERISSLTSNPEEWLLPFITSSSLSADSVYQALVYYFSDTRLDENVPEQIFLQNGNRAKLKYENLASPEDRLKLVIRPVIDIIIQRAFGCIKTPQIAGMKVLFRLLSPAQRPLQITDDLENFWTSTWPEICKEMKGRYPKHNWDVSKPQKDKNE